MAVDVAAIKARLPSYGIVDAVEAPGGGVWALGADGGVFALDGAPFFGSYHSDSMASARNDPNRRFSAIQADPDTGGYQIVSRDGDRYRLFDPNRPKATDTPAPAAPAPTTTPAGPDGAQAGVGYFLDQMGLAGLAEKAWEYVKSLGGTATPDSVAIWIRTQPKFKEKFPAMADLEARGEYWTPAEYLTYDRTVRDTMRSAGIPSGFWDDPEDVATLIRNNWSADEVTDAVRQAEMATLTLPPDVKAQMDAYGFTNGDLTAFWLNPDKGQTLMERKFATETATVGAAGTRAGFGLSRDQASLLTQQVGVEGASSGLARYGAQSELLAETAEETVDLGTGTVLAAVGGDVAAGKAVERRRQTRTARFEGGGGAQGLGQGRSGLGSA